jgi:hypothetical protein
MAFMEQRALSRHGIAWHAPTQLSQRQMQLSVPLMESRAVVERPHLFYD